MMKKTSIIPGTLLLLAAWSVHARNLWYKDDDSTLQPILSQSRKTRVCSELCMSGLGGTPCGDSCFDLIPANLPIAGQNKDSQNASHSSSGSGKRYNATTREDSCDVLCKNRLGYPLCGCNYDNNQPYATDFVEICSTFCVNYGYQLFGCQNCTLYKAFVTSKSSSSDNPFDMASLTLGTTLEVGWGYWCREVCSDGNGGAACECDLLP